MNLLNRFNPKNLISKLKTPSPKVIEQINIPDHTLETPTLVTATLESSNNDPYEAFLERLRKDGGDKILQFKRNFLHVEYLRFQELCKELQGLSLHHALLHMKWSRSNLQSRMMETLSEVIVKAKENGYDLEKTYIADACTTNGAILSSRHVNSYIRGRGRYGATPHPKSALMTLLIQERDKPFASKYQDPIEKVKHELRLKQLPWVKDPNSLYEYKRSLSRPNKKVYC